uniref:InlB B-repeat-containing protein n=1 Tax=Prevotella sp. TaxID=59823 RepID=UPI00402638A7
MATNALNLSQVQTVTEQLHTDLVARASMLNDQMPDKLHLTVTTDVENIDKLFIFNDKGLLARQYKQGAVKKVQLGIITENPAKVILAVTHPQDNVQKYREKEPFHVNPDGTNNAEKTQFLLGKIAERHAQDVRANFFFGNEANANLEETTANQVKLGLSLYDGIYTKIAKGITTGKISKTIGNLVETGDLMASSVTSQQAYEKFKAMYQAINDDLRAAEEVIAYTSSALADKIVEGYMLVHPQLAPSTLNEGWKFSQMPNLTLVTHSAMGKGSQIIMGLPGVLEYICDIRPESQANITVERNSDDHNLFDYQIQTAQASRIRDYSPKSICVNEQVNTPNSVPAGDYIADVFTVSTSDEKEGTAKITSGEKDLYAEGDIITVTATPKTQYKFAGWSDGATANPYNYTFEGGVMNLVAQFEEAAAGTSSK